MNANSTKRIFDSLINKGILTQDVVDVLQRTDKILDVETSDGTLYIDVDIPISEISEILPMNTDNTITILGTTFNADANENDDSTTTLTKTI